MRRSNKLTQAAAVYSELASGNQGIVVRDKVKGSWFKAAEARFLLVQHVNAGTLSKDVKT